MSMQWLNRLSARALRRVVPAGVSVGEVQVDLVQCAMTVTELEAAGLRIRESRVCWSGVAFFTPTTPFLEVEVCDAECTLRELKFSRRHRETSRPKTEGETSVVVWLLRVVARLVADLAACFAWWFCSTILSDVRVTFARCAVVVDEMTVRVEAARLDVCAKDVDAERDSSAATPSLSCALRVSTAAVASPDGRIDIADAVWTLETAPANRLQSSLAVASTGVVVDDASLLELGPTRLKLARPYDDVTTARLDVEFYNDAKTRVLDLAAVQKKNFLDCRARLLEPVDFRAEAVHVAKLLSLDDANASSSSTQASTTSSFLEFLDADSVEFQVQLKAAVTMTYDALTATIDRHAKLSASIEEERWRLWVSAPVVYAVTSSAAASLTLETVEVVNRDDRGLSLAVNAIEARLDSTFAESEDAAAFARLCARGQSARKTTTTTTTTEYSARAATFRLVADGEVALEARNAHLTGGGFDCGRVRFGTKLADLTESETGAPAIRASFAGDVRLGHISLALDDPEDRDHVRLFSALYAKVRKAAESTEDLPRPTQPIEQPTQPIDWHVQVASIAVARDLFALRVSGLDVRRTRASFSAATLNCSSMIEMHREMCRCESFKLDGDRARCAALRISCVGEAWYSCIAGALDLKRQTFPTPEQKGGVSSSLQLDAETFEFALPVAARSPRRLVLQGRDASFSTTRACVRTPRVVSHDGRVVAALGPAINARFDLAKLVVSVECSQVSSTRFDVQDYLVLRHALWRNLAGADDVGAIVAPTKTQTEFRVEVCADAVRGTLVDETNAFRVDAKSVVLVVDRYVRALHAFSVTSAAVDIHELTPDGSGARLAEAKQGAQQTFAFEVGQTKTVLSVSSTDLLWQANKTSWFQLKDFFSFRYVRDTIRDGPLGIVPPEEEPREVGQSFAFELLILRSTVTFSLVETIPVAAESVKYRYTWSTDDAACHVVDVRDAATSVRVDARLATLSYDSSTSLLTLVAATVVAPNFEAISSDLAMARAIAATITDTVLPGGGSTTSETSTSVESENVTLQIGDNEWALRAARLFVADAGSDIAASNVAISAQNETIFRLEDAALTNLDELSVSGPVVFNSIPKAAALAKAISGFQWQSTDHDVAQERSQSSSSIKRFSLSQARVAVTPDLACIVENIVFNAANASINTVYVEHLGKLVVSTRGSLAGSVTELQVPGLELVWSKHLVSELQLAFNDITSAFSLWSSSSSSFEETKPTASSSERRGRFQFAVRELVASHADVGATFKATLEVDAHTMPYALNEVRLRVEKALLSADSLLAEPTTITASFSPKDVNLNVSSVAVALASHDVSRLVGYFTRESYVPSPPPTTTTIESKTTNVSIVCRGLDLQVAAADSTTLRATTQEIVASFKTDGSKWAVIVAAPNVMHADGQTVACLEHSASKDVTAPEECVLAARSNNVDGTTVALASRPLWGMLTDEEVFTDNPKRRARLWIRADASAIVTCERLFFEAYETTDNCASSSDGSTPSARTTKTKWPTRLSSFRLNSCRVGLRVIVVKKTSSGNASTLLLQGATTSSMARRSPYPASLGSDELSAELEARIGGSGDHVSLDVLSVRASVRQGVRNEDVLFAFQDEEAVIGTQVFAGKCLVTILSPMSRCVNNSAAKAFLAAGLAAAQAPTTSSACHRAARAARIAATAPYGKKAAHGLDIVATFVEDLSSRRTVMLATLPDRQQLRPGEVIHVVQRESKEKVHSLEPKQMRPHPVSYAVVFKAPKLGLTLGSRRGEDVYIERIASGPNGAAARAAGIVPGDILLAVAGKPVAKGERCLDVAGRIAKARRPLTLELRRASTVQTGGADDDHASDSPQTVIDDKSYDNDQTSLNFVVAAGFTLVVADHDEDKDGSLRLSARRLEVTFFPGKGTTETAVSLLQFDIRRAGEWEPALEPCLVRVSSRSKRVEVTINGDDSVDGEMGDGDCLSLRVNVSLPLLRATLAAIDLASSGIAAAAGASEDVPVVRHSHVVRDNFFGDGDSRSQSVAEVAALKHDNLPLQSNNAMAVMLRVDALRLSIVEGGSEDVPQCEALVLTIKDAIAEYSVKREQHRCNLYIEDAQLDSHSTRHGGAPFFPVVMRARPKRRKLTDVIGAQTISKRTFAVASASWEHIAHDDHERIVVDDLRADLGKVDIYIDETAARDALDMTAHFVDECLRARRKDVVVAKDEVLSRRSYVLERVEISKIDARLSVRWTSETASSNDGGPATGLANGAKNKKALAGGEPGSVSKKHNSPFAEAASRQTTLYAQSLAAQAQRAPRSPGASSLPAKTGARTITATPFGTPSFQENSKLRALLEVFAAVEQSKITLPPLRVREPTSFADINELMRFARAHYSRGAARNALEIVGSLRAIGNPLGLARGVLQGVEDALREPVQGLIEGIDEDRPEAFALGLRRGASSLVRHTVGGTADSLAAITGNFSLVASHLAFDGDYRRRQVRKDERRSQGAPYGAPRSKDTAIIEGLANGFDSAVGGVVDGVTGLVQAPIRGAERGGAAGAIRGVGQGVLGLVVKPVVGVADAATDVLRGIRDTTDADAAAARRRGASSSFTSGPPTNDAIQNREGGSQRGRPGSYGGRPIVGRTASNRGLSAKSPHSSPSGLQANGRTGSTEDLGALGDDAESFDQAPARVRPVRAVYGRARTLRPYSLRDARASAALRAACHDAIGIEPPGVDAFREFVVLDADGSLLVISDGAIAFVRQNTPPLVVTPLTQLVGCSLEEDEHCMVILVAPSSHAITTTPTMPERHSIPYTAPGVGRRAHDALADVITRSRDAAHRNLQRRSTAALRTT